MQEQREIINKIDLLKSDGTLNTVGWARKCDIINYNKENIPKKLRWRKKEWDFYQTSDGEWVVQLNFANISVGAAGTCTVLNIKTGEKYDFGTLDVFTKNRLALASKTADDVSCFEYSQGKTKFKFDVQEDKRVLTYSSEKKGMVLDVNLTMYHLPNNESISIITPFDNLPHRFFYTTKYNCMPTVGTVKIGDKIITFDKEKTYSVIDWGRGVWPHKNYWYWGNGSTKIDGKYFGFEITWGIGNTSLATETCLFYDGKAHKIGAVDVEVHPKINGYLNDWVFKSDDGRFNLTMTPFFDNATGMLFLNLLGMRTHQVHGYFNGDVTLDDGTKLKIENMYAFCEFVENRW